MDKRAWPTGIRPARNGIQIRIYHQGKEYKATVKGDAYSKTDLASAVRERERILSRLDLGLPVFTESDHKTDLFGNVAQSYIAALGVKYSTALSYKNILEKYWLPSFGHWLIHEIKSSHIKTVIVRLNVSQIRKRNILIPLRGVLKHAQDDNLIENNPADQINIGRHQKAPIERFLPKERDKILEQLEGDALLYFTILFGTGMRPGGEMLGLDWEDYDGEFIYISKQVVRRRLEKTTKTHVTRKVYIEKWLRAIINNWPTRFQGGPMFKDSTGERRKTSKRFNEEWQVALRRARVRYRIPYTCRHTRAAELLSNGNEPGFASKQLGHSIEMFSRIYSEWIDEMARQSEYEKLESRSSAPKPAQKKEGFFN